MLYVVINVVNIGLKNWFVYYGKVVLNVILLKIVFYYIKYFCFIFEIFKKIYEIYLMYLNMDINMCLLCFNLDFKYMYNLKLKKSIFGFSN